MRKKKASPYGQGFSTFKNSRGGWVGSVQISTSPRKHKTKTFATAEDAESWCREQVTLIRSKKIDVQKGAQLLTTFCSTWFNDVASEKDLKQKTLENYRLRIQYYILPYLGSKRLDVIVPEDIQRWMNKLRAEGMAQSTVRDVFNLLKQILKIAKIWKYIPENPCDEIKPARVKPIEKEPFTIAELIAVFDAAAGNRNECAFWVAALLGLRLGEVLGLRWADFDSARAELRIAQQVQNMSEDYEDAEGQIRTRHYVVIVDSTKTENGARTDPLPSVLVDMLHAHHARQLEEQLYLGKAWTNSDLIFPSETGTPRNPRNFEASWYLVRTAAGIAHGRNFHLFRHTANSLMVDLGILDAVRADIFGWTKKGIIGHYSHPSAAAKRTAMEALTRMVLDEVEKARRTG